MKKLLWDYKEKRLLDCQDFVLNVTMNSGSQICQLEFILDFSYYDWIQEWLHTNSKFSFVVDYKRSLHLNNDIVFYGCYPKSVNFDNQNQTIELIIACDAHHALPFKQILEVHRDLIISEILNS